MYALVHYEIDTGYPVLSNFVSTFCWVESKKQVVLNKVFKYVIKLNLCVILCLTVRFSLLPVFNHPNYSLSESAPVPIDSDIWSSTVYKFKKKY